MEEYLKEKIRNHTADDVDKEMIMARLKVTHEALKVRLSELTSALEHLEEFCRDKKFELSLLDFSLVMAFDDKLSMTLSWNNLTVFPVFVRLAARKRLKLFLKPCSMSLTAEVSVVYLRSLILLAGVANLALPGIHIKGFGPIQGTAREQ